MFIKSLLITSLTFTCMVGASEHTYSMKKGDTLWSLSQRFLKDPYRWNEITLLNGRSVPDPRRMAIGTILLIPAELVSAAGAVALTPNKTNDLLVTNKSLSQIISNLTTKQRHQLWNYYLTHKTGLVRAFYNGNEVIIEARLLIEQMKQMGKKYEKIKS